jgi:hypothetical protein
MAVLWNGDVDTLIANLAFGIMSLQVAELHAGEKGLDEQRPIL